MEIIFIILANLFGILNIIGAIEGAITNRQIIIKDFQDNPGPLFNLTILAFVMWHFFKS